MEKGSGAGLEKEEVTLEATYCNAPRRGRGTACGWSACKPPPLGDGRPVDEEESCGFDWSPAGYYIGENERAIFTVVGIASTMEKMY